MSKWISERRKDMIARQGIIFEWQPKMQTRAARFKNHRRFAKFAQAYRELQAKELKKQTI